MDFLRKKNRQKTGNSSQTSGRSDSSIPESSDPDSSPETSVRIESEYAKLPQRSYEEGVPELGLDTPSVKGILDASFPDLPDLVGFKERYNKLVGDEEKNNVDWKSIVEKYNTAKNDFEKLKGTVAPILNIFDLNTEDVHNKLTNNLGDIETLLQAGEQVDKLVNKTNDSIQNLKYSIPQFVDNEDSTSIKERINSTTIALSIDTKLEYYEPLEEYKTNYEQMLYNYILFRNELNRIALSVSNIGTTIQTQVYAKMKQYTSGLLKDQFYKAKAINQEDLTSSLAESSAEFPLYRAANTYLSKLNFFDQIFLNGNTYTIDDVYKPTEDSILFVKYKKYFQDQTKTRVVVVRSVDQAVDNSVNQGEQFIPNETWNESKVIRIIKKDGNEYKFKNSPLFLERNPNSEQIIDPQQSQNISSYDSIPKFSKYLVELGKEMKKLLLEAKQKADDAKRDLDEKGADSDATKEKIEKMKEFAKNFLKKGEETKITATQIRNKLKGGGGRAEGSLLLDPLSRSPPYRRLPAYGRAMQLKALATD